MSPPYPFEVRGYVFDAAPAKEGLEGSPHGVNAEVAQGFTAEAGVGGGMLDTLVEAENAHELARAEVEVVEGAEMADAGGGGTGVENTGEGDAGGGGVELGG